MRLWVVALVLLFLAGVGHADQALADAVNTLRIAAGLAPLTRSAALDEAAARHAAYLDQHREPGAQPAGNPAGDSAHRQQPGRQGFTGELPAARAIAAGYPHREVLENVSMGYADSASALDGLMSAIYHRLTFLDLRADEIGVAVGDRSRVFLLGRSDLRGPCRAPPAASLARTPLDCLGQSMTRAHYEQLCAALPAAAAFRPAHPVACPGGKRLDAEFMARVCNQPPPGARFRGYGRFYQPCENATRIDADWFDALCRNPPTAAVHRTSGRYFELCEPPQKVSAAWFEAYCTALPETARYTDSGRFRRPCAAPHSLRIEFLDALVQDVLREGPAFVVWPPPDARDVPPAFFLEEPDPLPDRAVAGNPVSLQISPAHAGQVELARFALFRLEGDVRTPIEATRLLDSASDPNGLLSTHEFALFPMQRLDWGARYEALADVVLNGEPRSLVWRFTTRPGAATVFTAKSDRQRFIVPSSEPVWLYLPPREGQPHTVLRSRTSFRRGNKVTLSVIDPNTAEITVEARYCDRVTVTFEPERVVELVPAGCPG